MDDSTKNIYGPNTSKWTTESDLFVNRPNYRPLDTTITNYHRWTYVQRFNNFYQDLGAMGTALNPIFAQAPSIIGATNGFSVYAPYYFTEDPRYYDTKSPHTRIHIIWGGKGRAMTHVEFARNINPRWNFGFNYRPILVEKQIQSKGRGDYQTTSHYYDFFTSYTSKNERYALLANYRRIRHRVFENGGIVLQELDPFPLFFDVNARPRFTTARSEEYRRNIHLSHHYQFAKSLQVYHIADISKHINGFTADRAVDANALFDITIIDGEKTNDQTSFISSQNEVGIKGNALSFFYDAYIRLRDFNYSNPYLDTIKLVVPTSGNEKYIGGRLGYNLDSLSQLSGAAEYLDGGFYRIEGKIRTPWLDGDFINSYSKPGFMQMMYRGSHDFWNQPFSGFNFTKTQVFVKYGLGPIKLQAGGSYTSQRDYIYFRERISTTEKQRVLPYQSSGNQTFVSPEVRAEVRFLKHVYFRPQIIYTKFINNADSALRIPQVFSNFQLAYENLLFKEHLQLQAGVDVHWRSAYQAMDYDPVIQQFYVQDRTTIASYPLVDIFVNGKMRRGRFFFKYHNLVQAITKSGYLITPNYPGQRNIIDFGFDFLLFD
ncbi:MAG: putative porin [Cyclobacteriaceae bacterium]|nr:putative porin [Cyclobacteriaceae bacterium]